jgi:hypothetical protein
MTDFFPPCYDSFTSGQPENRIRLIIGSDLERKDLKIPLKIEKTGGRSRDASSTASTRSEIGTTLALHILKCVVRRLASNR